MADKETLFVVVGVNEPAGNAVGPMAADLASAGVEHVRAVDPDLELLGIPIGPPPAGCQYPARRR